MWHLRERESERKEQKGGVRKANFLVPDNWMRDLIAGLFSFSSFYISIFFFSSPIQGNDRFVTCARLFIIIADSWGAVQAEWT